MLFYSDTEDDELFAYIRNHGFISVDAQSARKGEPLQPSVSLIPTDEVLAFTNPYGDVVLYHYRLGDNVVYNTVLQELQEADFPNLFSVENGAWNPYTKMLRDPVLVDLDPSDHYHTRYPDVWLQYDPYSKGISVRVNDEDNNMGPVLFCMKKDAFIEEFEITACDE